MCIACSALAATCSRSFLSLHLIRNDRVSNLAMSACQFPIETVDYVLYSFLSTSCYCGSCFMWCSTGARHEADDVLLLRIHWPDGHSAWVNRYALHVRPHCHLKLIDFYESKAKPKH